VSSANTTAPSSHAKPNQRGPRCPASRHATATRAAA